MIFLYIALGLLVVFVLVGLFLPSDYSVSQHAYVEAPPEKVHEWVGHLDKWAEWMPWEEEDPTIVTTLEEQTTGVGAHQSWTSAKQGGGEVTFTACDETSGIEYDMTMFFKPDKPCPSKASVRYSPEGAGTKVSWNMEGDMNAMMPPVLRGYFAKLMPKMIGKMFDKGLANLKRHVEAA